MCPTIPDSETCLFFSYIKITEHFCLILLNILHVLSHGTNPPIYDIVIIYYPSVYTQREVEDEEA